MDSFSDLKEWAESVGLPFPMEADPHVRQITPRRHKFKAVRVVCPVCKNSFKTTKPGVARCNKCGCFRCVIVPKGEKR